jgi:hypothetical protein
LNTLFCLVLIEHYLSLGVPWLAHVEEERNLLALYRVQYFEERRYVYCKIM